MRITEKISSIFNRKKEGVLDELRSALWGTGGKFVRDVYGEKVLSPSQIFRQTRLLYETNSFVASAVGTMKDFIIGDNLTVNGSLASKKFFDDWFKKTNFKIALDSAIENLVITGNGYIIVQRDSLGNIQKFIPVYDSSRVYHIRDSNGNLIGYAMRKYKGKSITVWDGMTNITIIGQKYDLKDMVYLKWGEFYGYGRSPLCSSVSDGEIIREIERAIAVISRYKAVPKKIVISKGSNNMQLQEIARLLETASDFQNPVTGYDIEVQDLSYSGNIDLNSYLDYFKRKITSGLTPDYIVHGEETNRATAKEQRLSFMYRVKSLRNLIKKQTSWVITEVASKYNLSATEIDFGEIDLNDEMQEKTLTLNMFNAGVITINEARQLLGLEPIPEENDAFKWEIEPNGQQNIPQS